MLDIKKHILACGVVVIAPFATTQLYAVNSCSKYHVHSLHSFASDKQSSMTMLVASSILLGAVTGTCAKKLVSPYDGPQWWLFVWLAEWQARKALLHGLIRDCQCDEQMKYYMSYLAWISSWIAYLV